MRSSLLALSAAAAAVLAVTAFAQEAPPDYSQDMRWQSAQQNALAQRAAEGGWRALEGGLLWRRIEGDGSGPHPQLSDTVTVHYAGTFVDGTTFDSSFDRGTPATFPLGRLIKAWQIAIPEMGVGDTIEIAVPSTLGYGAKGKGSIPGGATLLFTVKLIDIKN